MRKRILSAFLALTMLLTLMPTAVFAAEAGTWAEECDIVYETHPGIGSIDDILPLSTGFGLRPGVEYTGKYYDQLDDSSKAVYDAIYSSNLKNGPTSEVIAIDLSTVPTEDRTFYGVTVTLGKSTTGQYSTSCADTEEYRNSAIAAAIGALLYDHPELSWLVNTPYQYGSTDSLGNKLTEELFPGFSSIGNGSSKDYTKDVTVTELRYFMSEQGVEYATTAPSGTVTSANSKYADTKDRAAITSAITAAKSSIGTLSDKSDYEKVKTLYEWICNNMEYAHYRVESDGYNAEEAAKFKNSWRGYQTVYSALVEKVTVCAGYAKAFKLLCDEYNIPCAIVTGQSNGENHAWNYVQIGSSWYAIDCTWADQSTYISYNYLLKGSKSFTDHTEGTLYSTYQFAYPKLSTEDYKDTSSPTDISITYTPNHTATSSANHPGFAVPVISQLGTPAENVITLTASLTGGTGQKVEWTLSNAADGIALIPGEGNTAKLVIQNSALKDRNPSDTNGLTGPVVTVTAMCGTTSASTELWIYVAHRTPQFIQVLKGTSAVATDTVNQGNTAAYTAKVYDQYGQEMTGQTVNWSVTGGTGVTVSNGTVSVANNAAAGTYTVTATSGSGSASVTITVPQTGHTHTWSDEWSYDNTYHWHACTDSTCTEVSDKAEHEWAVDMESLDQIDYFCRQCYAIMTHREKTQWSNDDTYHWRECADHEDCGITFEKGQHDWGTGVVTAPATCTTAGSRTYTCKCGQTKTETIPAIGHQWSTDWKTDGTNHWHVCTVCGAESTHTTHNWNEGIETKAPTCTEAGIKTFTCTDCGQTSTETLPAVGHQWSTGWQTDGANHWHVCEVCGTISDSAAHNFDSGSITVQPTYEAAGLKTYTCTMCHYTKTESIPQLTHNYSTVWSKDENTHWHACTDAGYTNLKADEAAHIWNSGVQTAAPTYAAPGEMTYTCTTCGQTKTESIAQLEHKYSSVWSMDNDYHWHVCTDTGFESLTKDKAAHTWDAGQVTLEPTDETDGVRTYTCTVCKQTKTETIGATGHTYSSDWSFDDTEHWHECTDPDCDKVSAKAVHTWTVVVTQEPTYDAPGSQTLTCSVCGHSKTEVVPQKEHVFSPLWSSDANSHWHACEEDGCTEKGSLAAHTWDAGTVTTEPSLASPGVKTFTCTVCGSTKLEPLDQLEHTYSEEWSKDNDYHWHACTDPGFESLTKDKAAHTWNAGTVTTEPTAETAGVKTYTCTVCGQTRTEAIDTLDPAPSHTHVWAASWSSNSTHHWHDCTVSDCGVTANSGKDGYGAHVYDGDMDTTCNVCGYTRTIAPQPAASYTITLDAAGGTVTPSILTTGADGKLTSLPAPTRTGYTFSGWYDAASGGAQVTVNTVFSSNSTIYAHWTSTSGTGSGSGSSSGSGSGSNSSSSSSSSSSSVQVPVSGDKNSVQVSATVSGSSATVSRLDTTQLNTVAGSDVNTGMVAIDFSGLKRTIQTVNLPSDTLGKIAQAAAAPDNDTKGLTVKLSTAEAAFDAAALSAIVNQASGSQITLSIAPASASALNARQKETVGDAPVFDLTLKSGTKTISNFSGGYITVSLPYTLKPGQSASGITVYYLDNSGNITACETMYDVRSETVMFTTSHLSLYFVGYAQTSTAPTNPFVDVAANAYYLDAVSWAVALGVTSGTSAVTFSPDASCTRGQMAVFLWRAAGSPEPSSTVNPFADVQADAYYFKAVLWASEQGITAGTSATTFSPDATVTRAQTVAFLYRATGSLRVSGSNAFTDVSADAYYADAVQWAVNNSITSGTSASTFSPDSPCTRAQIVTFLYRCENSK